jgi:hypothetical protein
MIAIGFTWERPMRRAAWLIGLAAAALPCCSGANADNSSSRMTFQQDTFGNIYLDGVITRDTPSDFERFAAGHPSVKCHVGHCSELPSIILFNSVGGDLDAGIALGRIIRARGMQTRITSERPISKDTIQMLAQQFQIPFDAMRDLELGSLVGYPGYCISACTLAFLGGVDRTFTYGSIYAVHQFRMECNRSSSQNDCPSADVALSVAQQMSATILKYLEDMGIPNSFFYDFVKASPDKLNVLSPDRLAKYHICGLENLYCRPKKAPSR